MSRLTIDGVGHRYDGADRDTLDAVSLTVASGSMLAVVGPSGSGKSTLLRVAAGLLAARTGRILLDGADVTAVPTEQRDLTVMFQAPLLFEHLDVAGNVAFPARLRGVDRRRARREAEEHLRLVHLDGYARRRVTSLSGGQQQRVALARALAARRSVLLLDEPFGSLDRTLRTAMHDLLSEVRSALGPTIMMVTHDLDEAAMAEEVAVLVDGRVHQQGTMRDLHLRPRTREVARLLGGCSEIAGHVDDRVHRSAWGPVPLDPACADLQGEAVLMLRREHVRLAADGGVEGEIVRRRAAGSRMLLDVRTRDGASVEVELAPDEAAPAGPRVRLRRAPDAPPAWALPCPDGTTAP